MICPKCGKETKSKQFCENCGENIEKVLEAKKQEKKEKIYKIKKKIAIILFIIFIILLSLIIGLNIYFSKKNFNEFKSKKEITEVEQNIVDEEAVFEEGEEEQFSLAEENKQLDYDGDNLTNEEEVKLGTDPLKKDTDGDGITDYEEINETHTDPLKWSTSGDEISDFAKIIKGMDVNTVYDKSTIEINNIEAKSNVTLVPKDIESEAKGIFREYSVDKKINSYKPTFSVYDFEGQILYELEDTDVVLLYKMINKYAEFSNYEINGRTMKINISKNDNGKEFVIVTKEKYKEYQQGGTK